MEWIDAKTELPAGHFKKYYLKIRWNEKMVGIIKTAGFYNPENKLFYTNSGSHFKIKYVQWLKED